MTNLITLKWGTLKGWVIDESDEEMMNLFDKYFEFGVCVSAAMQKDSPEQKEILIKILEHHKGKIYLDWDGKFVSKQEAIEYVKNYGVNT